MDYEKYKVEDFLIDEKFCQWAKGDNSLDTYWEQVRDDFPEKTPDIEKAKMLYQELKFKPNIIPAENAQNIWSGLQQEINKTPQQTEGRQLHLPSKSKNWNWLKIAAVLIPLFVISGIFLFQLRVEPIGSGNNDITWIEKENQKGQKLTLNLGDGSKIILNAESKLQLPEKFSKDKREVFLEGEAFFEVAKESDRPFIVYTNGVATKVLGTSFNINAYPENNNVQIALLTGKVEVEKTTGDHVILSPFEVLEVNKISKEMIKGTFQEDEVLAWKDGVLNFNNANQKEIIAKLERWYGVTFMIKKPIEGAFNGRFEQKSLKHVLEVISQASGFQFEILQKKVIIN